MREGFYSVAYAGVADQGFGVLAFDTGHIIGADAGGGAYDGTYSYNERTGNLDISVRVTIPAGVPTVQGVPAQDRPWEFPIDASIPRETSETPVQIDTPFGPVNVVFRFLRHFPD